MHFNSYLIFELVLCMESMNELNNIENLERRWLN